MRDEGLIEPKEEIKELFSYLLELQNHLLSTQNRLSSAARSDLGRKNEKIPKLPPKLRFKTEQIGPAKNSLRPAKI
jgi:hypothetical protein